MDDPARFIPEHVQANYEQIVEERHGGDWAKFARAAEAEGSPVVAAWAAARAGIGEEKTDTADDKTPKTTRKRG